MESRDANPVSEERLQEALQARYPQVEAAPTRLAALVGKIHARARRQAIMNTTLRSAAWVALAALFVFTFSWSLKALRPPRPAGETQLPPQVQGTHTPAASPSALPDTPAPQLTPAPAEDSVSALFPRASFRLGVELPAAPQFAQVYRQELPQPASVEGMRLIAGQLGLDAPLYMQPGEGPEPIYTMTDGFRMLRFAPPWSDLFTYHADYSAALDTGGAALPFEQAEAIARAYLEEKGLLTGEAEATPMLNQPGGVRFTRLLEGREVIFGVGYSPGQMDLDVIVNAQGEASQLSYAPRRMQSVGEFPILSAQQAWQAFLSGRAQGRTRYGIHMPSAPGSLQTWRRVYPAGQPVHVYGYVSILQPWDSAGERLAHLNNWLVAGPNAAAFAAQASPYQFWHTWGSFQADEQGRMAYYIEGWEISPLEEQYLNGTLRKAEGKTWLDGNQGALEVLDAPPGLPDGAPASAHGVFSAPGVLDWFYMDSGAWQDTGYSHTDTIGGGGGGGGSESFGGGAFKTVNLQAAQGATPTPTPAAMPSPYQEGQAVQGAAGTLTVVQHIFADGRSQVEFHLNAEPVEGFPEYWSAWLEGEAAQGLQALNGLPVRIWGHVDGAGPDGAPRILVERFEELYPGLRFQAWLGRWERVVIADKEVLLFTSVEGEQFVLRSSINFGMEAAIGLEGGQVILEGLARPGETYGSFPVLDESAASTANEVSDLSGYEMVSDRPSVWDESFSDAAQAGQLAGLGMVEQVELVYAASMLSFQGGGGGSWLTENDPEAAPWLYVQPVWRFRGSFEDGRTFEIQVQALVEQYLR